MSSAGIGCATGATSPATRSIRLAICCAGTTWSTLVLRIADSGISRAIASAGSWTITIPPQRLIADTPALPSSSAPLSKTALTRGPKATAAERNNTSMEGRHWFSRGPAVILM
jgi:hypothetical protein